MIHLFTIRSSDEVNSLFLSNSFIVRIAFWCALNSAIDSKSRVQNRITTNPQSTRLPPSVCAVKITSPS